MPGPIRHIHGAHQRVPAPFGKAPRKEPPRDRFVPSTRWSPPEALPFQAFRRPRSLDELLTAGNGDVKDLRTRDFASFRNDRDLGHKTARALRKQVYDLHRGERDPKEFRAWLRTEEGRPVLRQMVADVRRVVHARYLQGHGVQVPADLPDPALRDLHAYVQRMDTAYDVVDGVTALNRALARGERDGEALLRLSEQALYRERGVPESEVPRLATDDLRRLRRFADTWAPSRAGRALRSAFAGGTAGVAERIARHLAAEHGFALPPGLPARTAISLLRDLDSEGPRTARLYTQAVNRALAAGERDYLELTAAGNRAILASLGVETAIQDPDRLRQHRDLMAALPAPDRAEAARASDLGEWLVERLDELSGGLGERLARRGLQSAANTVSALQNVPVEVLEGLRGTPAEREREAVTRLADLVQERFGVTLHGTRGNFPGEGRNAPYSPFVKEFPLQAAAEVYAALEKMAPGGCPPGTRFVFMEGTPPASPLAVRAEPPLLEPWPRPGEALQTPGRSGFLGETSADDQGRDVVIYFDDSLHHPNSDITPGVSGGEGTMLHEIAHALQLGGPEDRRRTAEWSSLSVWQEADGALADGDEAGFHYYYDPAVRVQQRREVATSYGASDPSEDFAEFSPFFYTDPAVAMELSPEKFLYFNGMVGERYDPDEVWEVARQAGVDATRLARAARAVQERVSTSWERATPRPGHYEPA